MAFQILVLLATLFVFGGGAVAADTTGGAPTIGAAAFDTTGGMPTINGPASDTTGGPPTGAVDDTTGGAPTHH